MHCRKCRVDMPFCSCLTILVCFILFLCVCVCAHPTAGTEQALAADAHALGLLERLACLVSTDDEATVLPAFHAAKDQHIFRILASIANPTHTPQARRRALDELSKRTRRLGDAVADWTKRLVRMCAMGSSLNASVIRHCILLAQEAIREDDVPATAALVACVQTATEIFPDLCATDESFQTLTELLSECRAAVDDIKTELEERGVVTALSAILSATVASGKVCLVHEAKFGVSCSVGLTHSASSFPRQNFKDELSLTVDGLQSELLQMCTRDGTPEQARNAVHTLSCLLDDTNHNSMEKFTPLLNALTSPSRMTVDDDESSSPRSISILSSLAALAECAPGLFFGTRRGEKAVTFALESVLMGRGYNDAESDDVSSKSAKTPSSGRRARGSTPKKHLTPQPSASLLEDGHLSLACRRLCAAVEFLVSSIRASLFESLETKKSSLSPVLVKNVFDILIQLLRDEGLPPSNHDRKLCGARQDRAALRQCASIHILRLCDPRLGLDKKCLTPAMWHILSESFLDDERVVREAVMVELMSYLRGMGVYGTELSKFQSKAPPLRFLALICLCSDGDHGSEHDGANGNAANVHKVTSAVKNAATQCVEFLRDVSDNTYTQCRAMGKEAERKFETTFKMMLMPEYMVPYAIHLLSHRNETPFVEEPSEGDDGSEAHDEPSLADDASRQRVLRKRLKLLLEPLVQSLGDNADNISFLLRMVEIIGKQYRPVDVSAFGAPLSRPSIEASPLADIASPRNPYNAKRSYVLREKLKTVCGAAEEVLLSFVKKDVNLTPYPGTVKLPGMLFRRIGSTPAPRLSQSSAEESTQEKTPSKAGISRTPVAPKPALLTGARGSETKARAGNSSPLPRVHFSPDALLKKRTSPRLRAKFSHTPEDTSDFGDMSPIPSSKSPKSIQSHSKADDIGTLGSSPPSALRGATLRSTASVNDGSTTAESSSPASKANPDPSQSPIVLEEIVTKRDGNDDEMQTTSETQDSRSQSTAGRRKARQRRSRTSSRSKGTSQESSQPQWIRGRRKSIGKRKAPERTSISPAASKRSRSVPLQIQINRSSAEPAQHRGRSRAAVDDFDFADDEDDGLETRRNRNVRRSARSRK